jgi:hypothetical protein
MSMRLACVPLPLLLLPFCRCGDLDVCKRLRAARSNDLIANASASWRLGQDKLVSGVDVSRVYLVLEPADFLPFYLFNCPDWINSLGRSSLQTRDHGVVNTSL